MCAERNSDQVLGKPAMNESETPPQSIPLHGINDGQETRKRRILLVDDDHFALSAISKGLQLAGYETIQALTGRDALRQVAESTPDIAVLNISLPEMSGIELAKHLREQTTIPFMFLSSCGKSESVRQATEHGAVAYLVKPIHVTQLIPAIEVGLARSTEIGSLRLAQSVLTNALATARETNMAIGVLMERYQLDRQQAFEILRSHARAHRRKINCVAADVLNAQKVPDVFPPQSNKNPPDKQRILRHLAGYSKHPGADGKAPAQ